MVKIGRYPIIIGKKWINFYNMVLDMSESKISFKNFLYQYLGIKLKGELLKKLINDQEQSPNKNFNKIK